MYQIMNSYDQLPSDKKKEFDERFSRALSLDVSNRVIVAVEYVSNDPDATRNMKEFWTTSTAETLKQSVYLIGQSTGRVQLAEYYSPSPDGTGAKFIFPRVVNGKPLVSPEDSEVRFEFYAGPLEQKVNVNFKVSKMRYKDGLAY